MVSHVTKPLQGVRVLLSRSKDSHMARVLESAGAHIAASPLCLYTARPHSQLREQLERLGNGEFSWLCLTSPRTLAMISEAGFNVPELLAKAVNAGTRIAVVGPATSVSVFDTGQRAHLTAGDPPSSSALVESFSRFIVPEKRPVLIPCASIAKKTLPEGLRAAGWEVEVLHVYDTDSATVLPEVMEQALRVRNTPDDDTVTIFLVTSGSVARAASSLFTANSIERPPAVALGEPSASMLRQLDWETYGICPSTAMSDIIDTIGNAAAAIRSS